MAIYRRPRDVVWLAEAPRLASWDRAGSAGQRRLANFLDHVDLLTAPLRTCSGPLALELGVGVPPGVAPQVGGRDLDNYLFPLVYHLGARRFAAVFGRKVYGRSWLAIGPAEPDQQPMPPAMFAARLTGSYAKPLWKQTLRDQIIRTGATVAPPGPIAITITIGTGPGRNWANLWKPLIDSLGPILGEDPTRAFHPHDDRITTLNLHHHTDAGLRHDIDVALWWALTPIATVPP
jgi:hypothetical protein